jgi:hypothetical protein
MAPPKLNRKCSIDGCEKKHMAHGYCATHYKRFRLYGDPLILRQKQLHGVSLAERWWHYVEKGRGCWEWQGSRDNNGYGRLNVDGVPMLAHRLGWSLLRGEITPEQHVLHKCDNPRCVRPEHLFLGDQVENNADKMRKKRHRYGVSRGEDHGCAKLTADQVREIRIHKGPLRVIAAEYEISTTQASDIRRGRSWRHVT